MDSVAASKNPEPVPPIIIPDHQLLRCIGRGSYGEVWLARNVMGIYRAAKIVYRKSFDNQRPFDRELSGIRKFEPISCLYDGFVDVLLVGINEAQGYFYYLMELGDDRDSGQEVEPQSYSPKTLAKEISRHGKLPLADCLQFGLALSQALAELHKHGLVHRDIKPSNIIFVNGVPKLADIGLVAGVNEARSFVGTEGYIPPEGPGTPQADVYSLGKVLYEASTGKDRQEFPELPTLLDELPDQQGFLELNEVLLRACKNDLAERYPSAWDMHAHLLVLANGKSVKRLRLLEQRFARGKRWAVISAVVLFVLAPFAYQVYREKRVALAARQQEVGKSVANAIGAMDSGDLSAALPYVADALRLERGTRETELPQRLRFGSLLAQSPRLIQAWFFDKEVYEAALSPDGTQILVGQAFSQAKIFGIQTGNPTHVFEPKGAQSAVSFSRDGRFAATAVSEGRSITVFVWNTATLKQLCRLPHPNWVSSARFSPDGLRLVTGCQDGKARVWDAQSGALLQTLGGHTKAVTFAAFSPDGQRIVTTSKDDAARLWNATNGVPVGDPLKHKSWVNYAAFSPDGLTLVTASDDRTARLWDVKTGAPIRPYLEHGDVVKSAEFSPDGRFIITACFDGTVRLWSADTLQPLGPNSVLRLGERAIRAAFASDGRRIMAAGVEGSVRVWDLSGSSMAPVATPHSFSQDGRRFLVRTNDVLEVREAMSGLAISPLIRAGPTVEAARLSANGHFVLSISALETHSPATPRQLQVWNVADGRAVSPGILISNALAGFALSDDGQRVVTFGGRMAQIWDVLTPAALPVPLTSKERVDAVFFNPDSTRVATRAGKNVSVYDAASGRQLFAPLKHPQPASHAEFSPDGKYLATSCSDPRLTRLFAQVWNASTGQPVAGKLNHQDGVLFVSFSPDSRRVVTASEDFTAIIWDAATGRQLAPALKHKDQVHTAAFSPDGKWIVTASWDQTARVWDALTGEPLTPPLRRLAPLAGARFLADGRRIIASDIRGQTWIWTLPVVEGPVDDLVKLARLLSGGRETPAGRADPATAESLPSIWNRLRAKYPAEFAPSAEEIAAWHEFQIKDCEQEKQWAGAQFHLERLLALRPGDPSLTEHLIRVTNHLNDGK